MSNKLRKYEKTIGKILISLLAVFMRIQNIDIAFATNNAERSETDKSDLFQKGSLKIHSEGNLIYDSNNPSQKMEELFITLQEFRLN